MKEKKWNFDEKGYKIWKLLKQFTRFESHLRNGGVLYQKLSVVEVFYEEEFEWGTNGHWHVQEGTELVHAFASRACVACLALKRVRNIFLEQSEQPKKQPA